MSKPFTGISITALYTSGVWRWGKLPCAEALATREAKGVFLFTNMALAISGLFARKRPQLRHSLLQRHTMITALFHRSGFMNVLELASGLAPRGAAATADPRITYTEVDLDQVLERKRALLERTAQGRAILARRNYRLIEADVMEADLDTIAGASAPLFVIAEGLFMYFDAETQRSLWKRIADLLKKNRGGIFVFDLTPRVEEDDGGKASKVLDSAMKMFTDGKSFERDARTREEIVKELRSVGFSECVAFETRSVARTWKLPFPDANTKTVIFACSVGGFALPPELVSSSPRPV